MMFDSQHDAGTAQGATSFEPMARSSAAAKKSLRGRSGALLTSTALVAAATAMMASEASAQAGVPGGFAPAPADVVSYVQLSNGSVLVQLANQQSLLVTSNNFFIDGSGVLYLSPSVSSGIAGGGVASGATIGAAAPAPLVPSAPLPIGTTNIQQGSSGVIFEDTAAASSGGILGSVTGGPGLFGLGTLGTIAAIGLGGGAILLGANAIRSRLNNDDTTNTDNQAATLVVVDDAVTAGETGGSVTYAITDQDGIDESDLIASIEAGLAGASTVASVFPGGATVTTERSGSGLVEGTTDTFNSINVTLTGDVNSALNTGEFAGPAVTFNDAAGNAETVNFALNITGADDGNSGGGSTSTGTLELDATDGGTYDIAQGGTYLFKATDPEGDTVSYEISNNPTGVGIDSNTGLVTVASSVATGTHTITVKAMSTGTDGTVSMDTETYNINVTAGSGGGSPSNTVAADFDSTNAGFNTLNGVNITDAMIADSSDNEFEVTDDAHLANSFVMDGLGGDDTVYFSEYGGTYHLDPTWVNGFEDVSGFEKLVLMSNVDLEINGGVLDSTTTGDIDQIQGTGDNNIKLVNTDSDMGLDVTVTGIDMIDMNNYDLTLDKADLSGINKIMGDTQSTLVFTGQFSYDFAEGMIVTEDVTRIGLDAGNYDYSLTLDGVNDEDVREIYAYGANEIEGDVMIDTRMNSKITLIDLQGDTFTTGGLDGDSNIFATYDDELEILGGENDDDVDLYLESDVEDGELRVDLGGDDEDTLNIDLNGDEVDTRNYGRSIENVEFVDIDDQDGGGEAYLQFDGSSMDNSDIINVDMSDLQDDGGIILDGDLSLEATYIASGATQTLSSVSTVAYNHDATTFDATNTAAVIAAIGDATVADQATQTIIMDGFVADEDVSVVLTQGEDIVDLVIGESEFDLVLKDGDDVAIAAANYGTIAAFNSFAALAAAGTGAAVAAAAATAATLATNVYIETAAIDLTSTIAKGSQEVVVDLGGGDDTVNLVIGAAQSEDVTIKFAKANVDDHDTVDVNELEDLGVLAGNASDLRLDFADDVSQVISAGAVDASSVNVANSQHNAVLVFDSASQEGFIVDVDGDGVLSDGDILVDMTDALASISATNSTTMTAVTNQGDTFTFALSGGDLIDIA